MCDELKDTEFEVTRACAFTCKQHVALDSVRPTFAPSGAGSSSCSLLVFL